MEHKNVMCVGVWGVGNSFSVKPGGSYTKPPNINKAEYIPRDMYKRRENDKL